MGLRKTKVGTYDVTEENDHLKVSKSDKTFNFRFACVNGFIDGFFKNLKTEDGNNVFQIVFSSMEVFFKFAMTDFDFFRSYQLWFAEYWKMRDPKLTREQDDEIVKQEQALHDMEYKDDDTTKPE